jgi:GcrA cell cycle regulator
MPYTTKQLERAAAMWAGGVLSISDIVRAIGGTRSALAGYMVRDRELFPKRGRQKLVVRQPVAKPKPPAAKGTTRQPRPAKIPKKQALDWQVKPEALPAAEFVPTQIDLGPPLTIFKDLEPGQCKWIMSTLDDTAAEAPTCGRPVQEDKPFCPAHCRLAYVPASALQMRKLTPRVFGGGT